MAHRSERLRVVVATPLAEQYCELIERLVLRWGHGVQPMVWCGICPAVICHQSQNEWLNDRLLDPSHAGAPVIWECRAPEGQARACEPTSLSSVARLGDCPYGLELCSKEYA
jgi:hypothetical protein